MNRFVLRNIFIKIYIYHFLINIFYKKESKLGFRDQVVMLNDFIYGYGETIYIDKAMNSLTQNNH